MGFVLLLKNQNEQKRLVIPETLSLMCGGLFNEPLKFLYELAGVAAYTYRLSMIGQGRIELQRKGVK